MDNKRLDTLIRQGLMPASQLPVLHRALANLKMGKTLPPMERDAISKLMDKMMGFQFGDDITYARAKLHTQKNRYQTEEKNVADNNTEVIVHDGSEDQDEVKKDKKVKKNSKSSNVEKGEPKEPGKERTDEHVAHRPADKLDGDTESPVQGGSKKKPEITDGPKQMTKPDIKEGLVVKDLDSDGTKYKRLASRTNRKSKEMKLKDMPKELRKEKEKTGIAEDFIKFNNLYKENLERALANNKVGNVRDIPESIKGALFKHVEEATYSDKQIKMAKGIAFDPRHKGGDYSGAAKKAEKIAKGLSDHPKVSDALRRANEELELGLDENKLKDFAMDHGYDFDNPPKNPDKWLNDKAKKHGLGNNKKVTKKPDGTKTFKTESKIAKKDHDGDGKIETKKDEYFGSKDKAIKKAMKESEETPEETPVYKTQGDKIRDVHKTVYDVLTGGHTAQVSEVPLVVDPSMEMNKGTGNHFDNDVQEGAREDAMADIAKDKDLSKPKKPTEGKANKHDGSKDKGPEHIVAQLRKSISLGDKHDGVKFQDGKTHKVSAKDSHKFLNKYMGGKPADKEHMQSHGHASHNNFKTHID